MAVRVQNPFEANFENLSSMAGQGVKQAKKQASQAVQSVIGDVKQQVTGVEQNSNNQAPNTSLMQQLGLKPMPEEKKTDIQQKQQQNLAQTRQNLQKINDEIAQVRRRRLEEERQKKQQQAQEKQQKKQLEQQKNADPIWKRMLKGNQGAHEGNKHVSG